MLVRRLVSDLLSPVLAAGIRGDHAQAPADRKSEIISGNAIGGRLTWHHLRHNAGSYLLSENVPITAVSKILGHANPAITMSIYAHELREDLDQVRVAMAKFG